MNLTGDPIIFKGIERIVVALGAIIFGFLGYKLYKLGVTKGLGRLSIIFQGYKLYFLATGPGMFFMFFGAVVLAICLITGKAFVKITPDEKIVELAARAFQQEISRNRIFPNANVQPSIENLRVIDGASIELRKYYPERQHSERLLIVRYDIINGRVDSVEILYFSYEEQMHLARLIKKDIETWQYNIPIYGSVTVKFDFSSRLVSVALSYDLNIYKDDIKPEQFFFFF